MVCVGIQGNSYQGFPCFCVRCKIWNHTKKGVGSDFYNEVTTLQWWSGKLKCKIVGKDIVYLDLAQE